MNEINFKKIYNNIDIYSKGYSATFKNNGEVYHYKLTGSIIECQMTHIISLFLREIGVNALLYDYDDETTISYCKSLYKKGRKIY